MPSTKSAAKPKANRTNFEFEAIGTTWSIELYDPISTAGLKALRRLIAGRIDRFDLAYSRFRADSIVTQMSQAGGAYRLPADAPHLFKLYRQLYDLTDGALTPLIGNVLADAGYDASYTLAKSTSVQLQPPPSWEEALEVSPDGTSLRIKQPVLLDFGAAGKGYLVDIIGQLLGKKGIQHFCIDASGDLLYTGHQPVQIGLEHPDHPDQVIGVARLSQGALCGSATNRRRWGDYHHIMSPTTLTSPEHLKAVWVSAETALLADGLTTALFFVPAKKLQTTYTFEYACVYADDHLEASSGFPATFFTAEGL